MVITLYVCLLFFIGSLVREFPGPGLTIWFLFIATHWAVLVAGLLMLLFRLFKILNKNDGFLYVLACFFNLSIGLVNATLFYWRQLPPGSVSRELTYNLLLGVIICVDIFLLDHLQVKKNSSGKI